jgi:hypothetical protein
VDTLSGQMSNPWIQTSEKTVSAGMFFDGLVVFGVSLPRISIIDIGVSICHVVENTAASL